MKANLTLLVLAFSGLFANVASHAADAGAPLRVVPSVDFSRYQGKWYEIAHLPAWFQKDCVSDTTATYTPRPDGKITVLNACRKADGKVKTASGTAKVANGKESNTKLKVTFFWPFYGDYWIIDLDSQYQWAVIGEPKREYFWILSRTPHISPALYDRLLEHARAQGYDLSRLIVTRQTQENGFGAAFTLSIDKAVTIVRGNRHHRQLLSSAAVPGSYTESAKQSESP